MPCRAATLGQHIDATALASIDRGLLVQHLLELAAVSGAHRPYAPALSLGLVPGLEIGTSVTLVGIPDTIKRSWSSLIPENSIPFGLPIPKVLVRKGLVEGLDIGLSGVGYRDYLVVGGDIQLSLPERPEKPALALRLGFNWIDLDGKVRARTATAGLIFSKSFGGRVRLVPTASFEAGFTWGEISIPITVPAGTDPTLAAVLPSSIAGNPTRRHGEVGISLPLFLGWVAVTPGVSYNTMTSLTVGLKLSLALAGKVERRWIGADAPDVGWSPDPRNTSF